MSLQDIRASLRINEADLEGEWAGQPERYQEAIEAWADAEAQHDALKDALVVKKAEVAAAVRAEPAMYGLDRITDVAVTTTVETSDAVQKLKSQIIDAQKQARIIRGLVDATESKRRALENLVELYVCHNRGTPRLPEGSTGADIRNLSDRGHHDRIGERMNAKGPKKEGA